MNREILLGRTPEGTKVTVQIALRPAQNGDAARTVEHDRIPEGALELSISGTEYWRGRDVGGGQILETARTVEPSKQWSREDLDRLVAIWDRWHLNGMRAGCAHQVPTWAPDPRGYGFRPSLVLTKRCPHTGYRYGHAWLYEPLPQDVIDDVRRFQRRLGYPGYVR